VIQPGSKATDEYKRARDEIVAKLLPTAESYSAWWKAKFHARRKENKSPIDEKIMVPGTIEGPDKMFLTVLRRRGGEKVIGNNEMPMPWPSKENPRGDFIDPRALMKGQPKFISSAIHSVLTAQGEDKRQWLKLNFAKTAEALVDDIKDQIAGVGGNDVHYLNFKSSGSRVSLTVTSFVFPDPKKLHVSIEVPPNPRMARTFDVIVDDGEGNLYNPFFIETTSIVRGHPLQVHKTTRGTGLAPVEGMGDLSDLVGPRLGKNAEKSLQTNSRTRDGKIMRKEQANGRATALLREYIREVVITSNSTKRSTVTTKHRRKR
jgi:hypothetical protein